MTDSRFDFACSFFGYNRVMKNKISKDIIDSAYKDFIASNMDYFKWSLANYSKYKQYF